MKYDPDKACMMVPLSNLKAVKASILEALRSAREANNLPLEPYDRQGMLTPHDHMAIALFDVAANLDIDMPVTPHNHNKLDLRNR